jgi:secreted Zn-dependent insulinase-like peptidase
MPEEGMKMGHPNENLFMPNPDNLKDLKVERENPDVPGKPSLIKVAENFDLWFKQDDSFSQPKVYMKFEIDCNDCDWPYTMKSGYYSSLWSSMLQEASRELSYEASTAGISAGIKVGAKIQFEHFSYNDKVEPYLR